MSTKGRLLIRKLLKPLHPSECLVVADVTRTILFQRRGGFTRRMQSLITKFIDAGGVFCAITGDSIETVNEHLLTPLSYRGRHTFFVITAAGARIDCVDRDGIRCMYRGPKVPKQTRCELLDAMAQVLGVEFGVAFAFPADQRRVLLSTQGSRIDLAHGLGFHEPVYVEVRPAKGVTLFLEGSSNYGGHKLSLLRRFAENRKVRAIARSAGLRVSRGNDFTDLISSSKYEALASFFTCGVVRRLKLENRVVISIGDSPNDEGLFTYPYATKRDSIGLFVGSDKEFLNKVRRLRTTPNLIHLDGEFTKGTEFAFRQLCDCQ